MRKFCLADKTVNSFVIAVYMPMMCWRNGVLVNWKNDDLFSHPENKKGCKRMFATQPTTRSFAERRGFEPLIRFRRIRAFQARLFNHSSTSPRMGKDNDFSGNRPNFAPTNSPSGTIFSGHCRQKTLPHASEPGQTAFIPPGSRPFAVRQKAACLIAEERPARNRPYPKTNLQAQTV